jgi:hypothetical protein
MTPHHGYTRQPDDHEHCDMRGFITPEQQILNVAGTLTNHLRSRKYRHRQAAIRTTAEQLEQMLLDYFAGKLPAKPKDDCPF